MNLCNQLAQGNYSNICSPTHLPGWNISLTGTIVLGLAPTLDPFSSSKSHMNKPVAVFVRFSTIFLSCVCIRHVFCFVFCGFVKSWIWGLKILTVFQILTLYGCACVATLRPLSINSLQPGESNVIKERMDLPTEHESLMFN